jgi:hypothetical protein
MSKGYISKKKFRRLKKAKGKKRKKKSIKEEEMGRACSAEGRDEKCVQYFG